MQCRGVFEVNTVLLGKQFIQFNREAFMRQFYEAFSVMVASGLALLLKRKRTGIHKIFHQGEHS